MLPNEEGEGEGEGEGKIKSRGSKTSDRITFATAGDKGMRGCAWHLRVTLLNSALAISVRCDSSLGCIYRSSCQVPPSPGRGAQWGHSGGRGEGGGAVPPDVYESSVLPAPQSPGWSDIRTKYHFVQSEGWREIETGRLHVHAPYTFAFTLSLPSFFLRPSLPLPL